MDGDVELFTRSSDMLFPPAQVHHPRYTQREHDVEARTTQDAKNDETPHKNARPPDKTQNAQASL